MSGGLVNGYNIAQIAQQAQNAYYIAYKAQQRIEEVNKMVQNHSHSISGGAYINTLDNSGHHHAISTAQLATGFKIGAAII